MTEPSSGSPKAYRVDVLAPATSTLTDILQFFRPVDPAYGAAVVGQLLDAADTLGRLPYRFQVYRQSRTARRTVRAMPSGDYRIYYRVRERDAVVEVVMFRHAARRPPTRFPAT